MEIPPLTYLKSQSCTDPAHFVPVGCVQSRLCCHTSCFDLSVSLPAAGHHCHSQCSCFIGDPWMPVPTDERKGRTVLLDFPLFPSSSLKYTPGTFSLHNTIILSPHEGGALSYSDNSWLGILFVPLCTARCRGIGLELISTKAMSAVTWLQFILHLMAQITGNILYVQNENYSRAVINIQQGVPGEYRVQCSKSHKALMAHTWTETSGVVFGYFYTRRHT